MIATNKTKIGPRHQGRKMSLKPFEFAQVDESHRHELAGGYIAESEVPNYFHAMQVAALMESVFLHKSRDEYWHLGVKENWIVDASLEQTLLRRGRTQWTEKTLGPKNSFESKLLPGFKLPCRDVFGLVSDDE